MPPGTAVVSRVGMRILQRFQLNGRTALVTGGSRGLGRAIAQAFAEAGADLILVGRDADSLGAARAGTHGPWPPSRYDRWRCGYSRGRGCGLRGGTCSWPRHRHPGEQCRRPARRTSPTEDLPLDEWRKLFDLNLTSALVCCQKIGKSMLDRQRGSIINITSIAAVIAIKGIRGRHYETAKAALDRIDALSGGRLGDRGVSGERHRPGRLPDRPQPALVSREAGLRATFEAQIPMGRLGEPDELGPAAIFLASDASQLRHRRDARRRRRIYLLVRIARWIHVASHRRDRRPAECRQVVAVQLARRAGGSASSIRPPASRATASPPSIEAGGRFFELMDTGGMGIVDVGQPHRRRRAADSGGHRLGGGRGVSSSMSAKGSCRSTRRSRIGSAR